MREIAALRRDLVRESGLLGVLASADSGELDQRLRDRIELERLRKETERDRATWQELAAWLASHAAQPAPDDLSADALAEVARKAQEKEREAATHFNPAVAVLKSALKTPHNKFEADVQQLLRDGVEVLKGWLAFYHGLSKMLVRQAAERRGPGEVLRARLVAGDIDHGALSREFMARFPKIRAALAK